GEIMYSHQLIQGLIGTGNVYLLNGSEPRQMVQFPQDLSVYGLSIPANLPANFPDHWLDGNETSGNGVHATNGDTGVSLSGNLQNGQVVFNPSDHLGIEQRVLNIFCYACFIHDFVYLL